MNKNFPFIKIPKECEDIIGEPDPGTRLYKAYGSKKDEEKWFDTVWDICGSEKAISPGGAAGYAGVTRAGVHKRLKTGNLTGFVFYILEESRLIKGRKKITSFPFGPTFYCYIPVSECQAWRKEIEERKLKKEELERERNGDGDFMGECMDPPKDWRKKSSDYQRKINKKNKQQ